MRASSRLVRFFVAFASLLGVACTGAAAPAAERWNGLAETVFLHPGDRAMAGGSVFAQDADGFLWMGTQSGLVRWDGYRTQVFDGESQAHGALPDPWIRALHLDPRGRFWVGTHAGGLARFDPAVDAFVPVGAEAWPAGAPVGVEEIVDDGRDGLWLATSTGLAHLDAAGRIERILPATVGLPAGRVDSLLRDRRGDLWITAEAGALFRRAQGATGFVHVPLPTPDGRQAAASVMLEDGAGRIWIGTRAHGAMRVDPGAAGDPVVVRPVGAGVDRDRIKAIVEARSDEIWFGTDNGIVVLDVAHGSSRRLRHAIDRGMATSLADDDVDAMFRDRDGLLWIAGGAGLSLHDPSQRAVRTLLGGTGRPEALRHADAVSVHVRPDGHVWVGSGSDGVDIVDPRLGRVGQLAHDPAHPDSTLPQARVLSMVNDPRDDTVVLATRLGLYRSSPTGRRVTRIDVPGRDPHALSWSLCLDGETLWVGGFDGLWALDLHRSGHPVVLRHENADRLGDTRVVSIVRGPGDALWVGTQTGLLRLDLRSNVVETIPTDKADPTRLPPGFLSTMLIDRRGRLWVASFGHGVMLATGRDTAGTLRFRRFGIREGLPHPGVDKLLEDAHGDIWVSTDDGLAVIGGTDFAIRALRRPEGVAVFGHWTNAGAVTAAGELIFGAQGGLVIVRPEPGIPPARTARMVVTQARVGTTLLPPGRLASGPGGAPIEIGPTTRSLQVRFAALDYLAPERSRYAFRLDGVDPGWIVSDASARLATYTDLPPGEHLLELRGSNRDGVWSAPLAVPIRVQAAWHQTAWFRGGIVVLGVFAVGAMLHGRTALLRRRQRELEGLVASRTAELETSRRQLETLAYADALTGLPNRRSFHEELRRPWAFGDRAVEPFTLLLIDLDGLKIVNDTYGHDAGDALLAESASRIVRQMRDADRCARLGGDEFAVLLPGAWTSQTIEPICRRLIDALGAPVPFRDGIDVRAGASIGIAAYPQDGDTPDSLYKAADLALYAAKNGGRGTWRRGSGVEPGAGPPAGERRRGIAVDTAFVTAGPGGGRPGRGMSVASAAAPAPEARP